MFIEINKSSNLRKNGVMLQSRLGKWKHLVKNSSKDLPNYLMELFKTILQLSRS